MVALRPAFTLAWHLEERARLKAEAERAGAPIGRPSLGWRNCSVAARKELDELYKIAYPVTSNDVLDTGVAVLSFFGHTSEAIAGAIERSESTVTRRRQRGWEILKSLLGAEKVGNASERVLSTPSRLDPYEAPRLRQASWGTHVGLRPNRSPVAPSGD
jgi:hypothetical protein